MQPVQLSDQMSGLVSEQLGLRPGSEIDQRRELVLIEAAHLGVHHAQCPDTAPRDEERVPCVGTCSGALADHGVVAEACVLAKVGHHENPLSGEGVSADRVPARDVRAVQAECGLERLAFAVDQRDERDRDVQVPGSHPRDPVESLVRLLAGSGLERLENVQPLGLVRQLRPWLAHGFGSLGGSDPGRAVTFHCRSPDTSLICATRPIRFFHSV